MSKDILREPKEVPTRIDHSKARKAWLKEFPGGDWEAVRTQTKNRLAKVEMHHRNFHDLARAIMGVKK